MKVGELDREELHRRLAGDGLTWQVGPYLIRARTDLAEVGDGLQWLYARFESMNGTHVVDAEMRIAAIGPLRRRVRIVVDGEVQYDRLPRRLAIPMAEWSLNVCVFHRSHHYFMLHAGVVERGGFAAAFSGRAGSGKSTLCTALAHRGWRLLSDEVALVRPSDGLIQPVPRPMSLKERSIEVIRRFAPEAEVGPEWTDTPKGTVAHVLPPAESVSRADELAAPAWLVFPRFDAAGPTRLRPVSKARAFLRAAGDSFNYSVLGRTAFETLGDLIDRVDCFELQYADLETALREFEGTARASSTPPR